MYRCFHCEELHFSSDQAWCCADCGQDWLPGAIAEAERQLRRGPVPWWYKMAVRVRQPWTTSERALWNSLHRALVSEPIYSQWWLPGLDYRVDFLLPRPGLVVEVDGGSHRQKEGADRLRSLDIRANGYEVLRATRTDVMQDPDGIAAQIAFRVQETSRTTLRTQDAEIGAVA